MHFLSEAENLYSGPTLIVVVIISKRICGFITVAILFCSFEVLEVKFETFLSNLEIVELEEFVARRLENL